jgi:hypothetical protein
MTLEENTWYLEYLDEQNHWDYNTELKDSRQADVDYFKNIRKVNLIKRCESTSNQ